jgi:hypothetical protein
MFREPGLDATPHPILSRSSFPAPDMPNDFLQPVCLSIQDPASCQTIVIKSKD